jgi:RNA polymerase sigma-70 factor (ECF subfamily)
MPDNRKIFSKIYDQYINKIYRFVFLKVNSKEIAQDITSETFLRGWKAFDSKKDIKNPSAFLYQIARNLVVDFYREKGKAQIISVEYTQIIDPRINLEEKTIFESDINTVRLALANIREEYQEVIIWRYLDELSVPEIAETLDKSEQAVRVMLHRAMKSLKNKLNTN